MLNIKVTTANDFETLRLFHIKLYCKFSLSTNLNRKINCQYTLNNGININQIALAAQKSFDLITGK